MKDPLKESINKHSEALKSSAQKILGKSSQEGVKKVSSGVIKKIKYLVKFNCQDCKKITYLDSLFAIPTRDFIPHCAYCGDNNKTNYIGFAELDVSFNSTLKK